jgi:hypothetical protein
MIQRREIFLLNGTRTNWEIGRHRSVWGFPLHGRRFADALAELQRAGFAAGAEVVGVVGPLARLRAVVGSDRGVFWDETEVWPSDKQKDIYPVRIALTRIEDINAPWFAGDGWRDILEDRYFTERCLYVLRQGAERDPSVNAEVLFGRGEAK